MSSPILDAIIFLFSLDNLLWLALGTCLGLIAGTLPGISGVSMMALLLPFTYGLPPQTAVLMLVGVYAASVYSASTGGILYKIPGDAAGVPATVEGHAMAQKGKIGLALTADIYSSFIGSVIGFLGTLALTPVFIEIARSLGTAERGLFALFALVLAGTGALSRADPLRGMLAIGIGLMVGTIGMHQGTGFIRYFQPYPQLWDGINLVWLIVGLYAIPQTFRLVTLESYIKENKVSLKFEIWQETKAFFAYVSTRKWLVLKTGMMGTIVGALPGLGTIAASWIGYQEAYRTSKNPEEFGKGALEGLIGAETANNAAVPTTLVPLLALGIPGSAASSLILGAFLLAGVYPGPQMMTVNPEIIWSILLGLFLTGFFFVAFGLPFHGLAVYITKVRTAYLIPCIVGFSIIGTFIATGFVEGLYVTIAVGIFAVILEKCDLPVANVLLGAILGPIIERELLRAFQVGGIERFFRPVSGVLIAMIALLLAVSIWRALASTRGPQQRKEGAA
ncbi:tripartite tricarboxylate transporter permease [Puniceibacterium sp. IMCC21224]|uniref:tripartite tricarboxylate transporter permease n=1 Tax=Puniceibacterium sp. IMCC21224 TaxID=1618204 RepID=UPI00064D8F63|nr:tripartite tricarboxylate transporter permease [Puniceibacterium sp. IMCC21224]KMK65102.1 hypothetical protein IMCC21224_12347 [Puniceibacterium sp. IMCC21224]